MVRLDPESVTAIAREVVELLRVEPSRRRESLSWSHHQKEVAAPEPDDLVDAATLARQLGVSRATVYAKAGELGAVPLSDGPRPRLRFDPAVARERLTRAPDPSPSPTLPATKRIREPLGREGRVPLLPVKPREERQ